MIKISTLELPPEMIWIDRYKWQSVAQSSVNTLGGKIIVQSLQVLQGRPITLQANESQGWLTLSQVTSLITLAETITSGYAFEYHGATFTVLFNHISSSAVEMQPFVDGEEPSDFHFGTIKLICL